MISQHITARAVARVRRIGEVLPTAWVTITDEADTWQMSGSFLDLFLFAERLAAALMDEMPEHTREYLADMLADADDSCADDRCPCHEEGAA